MPDAHASPRKTTPGKARHLRRCAPHGRFVIFALDHRRNLWDAMAGHGPVDDARFAAFKRDGLMSACTAPITGVLTDPQYGLPTVADHAPAAAHGLLLPLEVTDYSLHPSRRAFRPIPGWSVGHIKRAGADGVKLLIYHHPDAANAAEQRAIVAGVVEQCAEHDIPFFCEPIAFSPDEAQPLSDEAYTAAVIANAEAMCALGIDVLKTEYPARPGASDAAQDAAVAALDAVCRAHGVPWTLLSGGVSYAVFSEQSVRALAAGASGVIVGRAVWGDVLELAGAERATERAAFWAETMPARIAALAALAHAAPAAAPLPQAALTGTWWEPA